MPATPDPTTRAPASSLRQSLETMSVGAAAATLVTYGVQTYLPNLPQEPQTALIVLLMAGGAVALSKARDKGLGGFLTGSR